MKIKCDICGGELVMLAGGKGAACKVCGMEHSIERIREMLGAAEPVQESMPKADEKVVVKPEKTTAPNKKKTVSVKSAKMVATAVDAEVGSVVTDFDAKSSAGVRLMSIEDIFSISGRGIVITGTIENGVVHSKDTVYINDKPFIVTAIEQYKKVIDTASAGMSVGILLKNASKKDFKAGDAVYSELEVDDFVQVDGIVEPETYEFLQVDGVVEAEEEEFEEEVELTESSLSDFVTKKKLGGTLEIKAYNGHAQRVIFPSAGPYGSLEARETLLAGHDEIVEIIFPNTFSPSDDGSIFRGLKNLKRVIFEKGTMASDEVFKDCKALEEVSLGDEKLVMLGTSYFSGCKKLKKVSIHTDAELSIFDSAFKNCSSLKEFIWANREVAELDFGDRVCSSTFEGCTSLKRVVLGDHIKAIHKDAFKNCTSLESVTTHSGDLSGIAIHPDAFKGASFQPENVGVCPQCGRKLICRKDPGNEYNTMICPESKCGFSNGEYD